MAKLDLSDTEVLTRASKTLPEAVLVQVQSVLCKLPKESISGANSASLGNFEDTMNSAVCIHQAEYVSRSQHAAVYFEHIRPWLDHKTVGKYKIARENLSKSVDLVGSI
jgi:hypothetical protein